MTNGLKTTLFVVLILCILCVLFYVFYGRTLLAYRNRIAIGGSYEFEPHDDAVYTPLAGFVPEAGYTKIVGEHTLVYVDILWSEFEPVEGVFAISQIYESNNLERWREEGKHIVLRFICDYPSAEPHMDIPEWLYEKIEGNGVFYNYEDSEKQGFSPDYNNPIFISYHEKAIKALGKYFGQDTFVSYVQLGSLGHWGEWHVQYDAGITRIPKEETRLLYIKPYMEAFPNAKLLMRRPFTPAAKNNFGLYNDMAGHPESTASWLDWIENGGDYNQALEKNVLSPMPNAWKTAPMGGEFNSSLSMDWMLRFNLSQTLELLEQSHTTFLGPKFPTGLTEESGLNCQDGIEAVRKALGYRFRVEKAIIGDSYKDKDTNVRIVLANDGAAPMYFDWPVYLYLLSENNRVMSKTQLPLKTTRLIPGEKLTAAANVAFDGSAKLCVGIEDPMTGKPCVPLTMQTEEIGSMFLLHTWENAAASE